MSELEDIKQNELEVIRQYIEIIKWMDDKLTQGNETYELKEQDETITLKEAQTIVINKLIDFINLNK